MAGGKIPTRRKPPPASRTPYSRPEKPPELPPPEEPENPNWLSGLIYPAKVIVSGAGKILSFFGSDSPSSSSDSDTSDNEDEAEVENDTSSLRDEPSNKVLSPSSKSDNKHAIEHLVMQENFSREEGDELIKLIKSRIVNTDGSLDESAAKLRTTAIMEAQKWLQQKRSGSKKKMDHELDITTLATPSKVDTSFFTEIGKGSPVDMAKSYMQNRPAWTSTSLKNTEFGSSSPLGVLNFKEETPKSKLRNYEMKRNSLSSGSWNILEEIRRVRSKATEELLASTPLTNTVMSSFSPESNQPKNSLTNNRDVEITVIAESMHDRPQNVLQDVSISRPGVSQDGNAVQSMEHQECQEAADLKSDKDDGVIELRSTAAENGFPSTAVGFNPGEDASQKPEPFEKENGDLVGSIRRETDVHMEDKANPEQEAAADISNANPNDIVANGSQNSSSMKLDEEPQKLSQPVAARTSKAKAKARAPPEERKSKGYTTRGRAKAK